MHSCFLQFQFKTDWVFTAVFTAEILIQGTAKCMLFGPKGMHVPVPGPCYPDRLCNGLSCRSHQPNAMAGSSSPGYSTPRIVALPAACLQQGLMKLFRLYAKAHHHLSAMPSSTYTFQLCQAAPACPSCACSPSDHCLGMAGPGVRAGGLHPHHSWSRRHLRPACVPGAPAAAHYQCIPRCVCTTAAVPIIQWLLPEHCLHTCPEFCSACTAPA